MDEDKVKSWKFILGFEQARQEGFTDHELLELRIRLGRECDNEIYRRASTVERDIRHRINWDGAIESVIAPKRPDIRPSQAYFVLPVKNDGDEEYSVLILAPGPNRWALTAWPYTSEFVGHLLYQDHLKSADWLEMMVEEFGLRPEQIPAWASPHIGSSIFDVKRHAIFHRELSLARQREARFRLDKYSKWLCERGLDGNVSVQRHFVVPASQMDYDPDESIFVYEVRLRHMNMSYSLISFPREDAPRFWAESYSDILEWHLTNPIEYQYYKLLEIIE